MNNILLRQIAAETGGSYRVITDVDGLPEAIQNDAGFVEIRRAVSNDIQLWNIVWLLALAVLLFATEWYLRKQAGLI
jgi:hypothetical protein